MNTFALTFFCVAVASASAGYLDWGHVAPLNHEAHIPSGSVSVSHDGALIAGPSGSIHTDNGIHGHGAGAKIAGPAGDVATKGGHAELTGPGYGHHADVHVAAPVAVAHVAPIVAPIVAPVATHAVVAGPTAHATIVGPTAHATIVAPVAHYAVAHQAVVAAPIAHYAVSHVAAPVAWGHHGVISHGLLAHGHHGW